MIRNYKLQQKALFLSARIEKKSQVNADRKGYREMSQASRGQRVESGNKRSNILEERSYQAVQPVIPVFASDQIGDWFVVETLVEYILRSLSTPCERRSRSDKWFGPENATAVLSCFSFAPWFLRFRFLRRAHDTLVTNVSRRYLRIKNSRRCYNSISWRIATTRLAERTCNRKFISVKFNDRSHKAMSR